MNIRKQLLLSYAIFHYNFLLETTRNMNQRNSQHNPSYEYSDKILTHLDFVMLNPYVAITRNVRVVNFPPHVDIYLLRMGITL